MSSVRTRPWMRAARALTLLAALAALVAAGAPPAAAAGLDLSKVTLKTKDITIEDQGFYGGTAKCPAGSRAVGGGIMTLTAAGVLDSSDPNNRALLQSGPTPDGKGWFGELYIATFTLSGARVRITAACLDADRLTGVKVVRKNLAVRGDTITFGGKATCPTGKKVLAGGATWHYPTQPAVIARGLSVALTGNGAPGETSWYASGYPTTTPLFGDPRLRITVVCIPASQLPGIVKVTGGLQGTIGDPYRSGTVSCPGTKRLLHAGAWTYAPEAGAGVSKSITFGGSASAPGIAPSMPRRPTRTRPTTSASSPTAADPSARQA